MLRVVGGQGENQLDNLTLKNLTPDQLATGCNCVFVHHRNMDQTGVLDGSGRLRPPSCEHSHVVQAGDALDLSKDPQVLARYGVDGPGVHPHVSRMVRTFCLARRLVEAGACGPTKTSAVGIGTGRTA